MRFPLMIRPRALYIDWHDHHYVITNRDGKLIAGTPETFLVDRATEKRTIEARARVGRSS